LTVDDEPLALTSMRALLAEDESVELRGECTSADAAEAALASQPIDLMFLDVQMPGRSGIELVRCLDPSRAPAIVFTTAYDTYAVAAFESNAVDYLLKPFSDARFAIALERAKHDIRLGRIDMLRSRLVSAVEALGASPTGAAYPAHIALRGTGGTEYVPVADIAWIEAADYYAWIHHRSGRTLARLSLDRLEARLDPSLFIRVHRSAIVRLSLVRRVVLDEGGKSAIVLASGDRVPLSRERRAFLERALVAPGRSE
jgi:two-component system LytT family response regulator